MAFPTNLTLQGAPKKNVGAYSSPAFLSWLLLLLDALSKVVSTRCSSEHLHAGMRQLLPRFFQAVLKMSVVRKAQHRHEMGL